MRLARYLGISACAVLSLSIAPLAAADSPHPWHEVNASDFQVPAGARCPFALSSTVLKDKERIRTIETFDNGDPRVQKVVGQLVVRLTNEDSDESVDRNLTGNGIFTWRQDGSLQSLALQSGHMAVGLRASDPGGPAFLVFTGAGHKVTFTEDGRRVITYGDGPVENICETLAG